MDDRSSWGIDDGIEHLHCGHCGSLDDLVQIDFQMPSTTLTTNPARWVRTLCAKCRLEILEWI